MKVVEWGRPTELITSKEYESNNALAAALAEAGLEEIIAKYTYVWPDQIRELLRLVPEAWASFKGNGVDLGGGVGCVTSAIAVLDDVRSIYCLELVENAVRICQPIVLAELPEQARQKVTSVLGNFDELQIADGTLDFAVMWDSLHHSSNPVETLREARRALKPGGRLVIVDRIHNNSVPDAEIVRMLDIEYSIDFKRLNFMDIDVTLTRRMNGEHEWRFREVQSFITEAGLDLLHVVGIFSNLSAEGNDFGREEIFYPVDYGGFIKKKFVMVCQK